MALFRHSAAGFAAMAMEGTLPVRLTEQLRHGTGAPSPSEIRSWERSLPVLAQDLVQAGLDEVEVLLEYQLPLTSKRIDVVLAGAHPRTGQPSYVVLELKQWSSARYYEGDPELVLVDGVADSGTAGALRAHPVAQVRGYCDHLVDFTTALAGRADAVAGAAYLHNATGGVDELFDYPQDSHGWLFTGQLRAEFLAFLTARLAPDVVGAPYADALLKSGVAPSKQLLAVAAAEIQHREQFVLLDEQRVAFQLVLHEVEKARRQDGKSVVVVTGGPGSGKSVIALSLFGELARRGRTVVHAAGSRSFTQTMRKVAAKGNPRLRALFLYFNSFVAAERNSLDVLILDEGTGSGRHRSIGTHLLLIATAAGRSTS